MLRGGRPHSAVPRDHSVRIHAPLSGYNLLVRTTILVFIAIAALSCGDGDDKPPECDPANSDCVAEAEARCMAIVSGSPCAEGDSCSYGTESCCYETHPAAVCSCGGGTWSCYATDACLDGAYKGYCSCPESECEGPAPGAPSVVCPDGSTGGPVCEQTGLSTCTWRVRECPEFPLR